MPETETHSDNDIAKVKAALDAEREAHKRTKAEYLAPIRKALALGDDANLDAITATLGTRLGDAEKIVSERTATLKAAHDEAVAKAAQVAAERNTERIEHAITAALGRSGILRPCTEDAAAIMRGVLEVKDGKVVTKAAPNIVPGMNADQFVTGQLRTMREHYWPLSKGAGIRGNHSLRPPNTADDSCFNPSSPHFNLTRAAALEVQYGTEWANRAHAKYLRKDGR